MIGSASSTDAGHELDLQAREYADNHNLTYEEAWSRVISRPHNQGLVRAYAAIDYQAPAVQLYAQHEEPEQKLFVGQELHTATERIMRERGEPDYPTAFQIALKLNPGLARTYGKVG